MNRKKFIKPFTFLLAATLFAGCSSNNTTEPSTDGTEGSEDTISGEITVLTNRTDIVDTKLPEYAEEFNKTYPDVEVNFEALTDYEGQTKVRLNSKDYGDVLLIPYMPRNELPQFFEPLGKEDELLKKYLFADEYSYEGTTYGIPVQVNTYGAVYNKKVFEEAGIKELPSTPQEYLEAMKKIKDNTDATPYYTNFSAGWPLSDWENQRLAIAGEGDYVSQQVPHMDDPFAEGRPHYTLYKLMYDLANQDLIEEDPFTTDWEQSKQLLADGEIGAMFLGVWAVSQVQALTDSPENIAYMPFPFTHEDGSRYAAMAGDYKLGINKHSENKEAARAWLDWFLNESGFAVEAGAISPVKGAELPESLADFENENVQFIENLPAKEGEEDLFGKLDLESEVGFGLDPFKQRIIEAGIGNRDETYEDITKELNQKWKEAREELGVE